MTPPVTGLVIRRVAQHCGYAARTARR